MNAILHVHIYNIYLSKSVLFWIFVKIVIAYTANLWNTHHKDILKLVSFLIYSKNRINSLTTKFNPSVMITFCTFISKQQAWYIGK